jgi:hypothetical protein
MRTLGILALTGLGIGIFLRTERGKQLMDQAKTAISDGKDRMMGMGQQQPEKMIQQALTTERPDTAMAMAFEEAVAA